MIKVNINNTEVLAKPGQMLIDVADSAGIAIPRFCYHPKLSVAANCRMCLVEVEGLKKTVPACATAISDGMVVHTQSERTKASQQAVMEFLLINHPLDCPICDQGGECELQDVAMGYGQDISRFCEQKRVVEDKDIGSLIQTDLTRCIHCTRCVRFGQEIAGIMELGMCGRGEHSEISSFLEKSIDSEMSGNVIDVCPVGALTSKPFRYSARAWEIVSRQGIAANDSSGSNLYRHVKNNQIKRVVPAQNEAINEVWLSDKDRFSYEGVNSPFRLLKPMVKVHEDYWEEKEWDEVLPLVVNKLQNSQGDLATVVHPNRTLEEMYLAQKLTRSLGSNHIDHRLYQRDFSQQDKWANYPISEVELAAMEDVDSVLIVGSNLCYEHPMVSHRLRKMTKKYDFKDKRVWQINHIEYSLRMPNEFLQADSENWLREIALVLKCVLEEKKSAPAGKKIGQLGLDGLTPSPLHTKLSQQLLSAKQPLIILGNLSTKADNFDTLIAWSKELAEQVGGHWLWLPPAANSVGAWVSGCVPHRVIAEASPKSLQQGDHCGIMQEKEYDTLLSVGAEIGVDIAIKANNVIALTTHKTATLHKYADIMLPMTCLEETAGTLINLQGDWQSFSASINPVGGAKAGWKILRVLGNFLHLQGFEYTSTKQIYDELKSSYDNTEATWQHVITEPLIANQEKGKNNNDFSLVIDEKFNDYSTEIDALQVAYHSSIYEDDMVIRHAPALQNTKYAHQLSGILVHSDTLHKLGNIESLIVGLKGYDEECELPVIADDDCEQGKISLPYRIQCRRDAMNTGKNFAYYPSSEISYLMAEDKFLLKLKSDFLVP